MAVGENIRKIRKEKGLTQKKLGELCGINEVQIRRYELGMANPKIETIDKIAFALEVDIVDIMDELPFKSKTQELGYVGIQEATDKGVLLDNGDLKRRTLRAFDKLNKNGQEEATKRIEELTEIKRYTKWD